MKTKYLYILLVVFTLSSCSTEENELEPTGIETGYTLPQGNNDFDTQIVDFYNQYGTYLLYDFTEKDSYWTPSQWNNGRPTSDEEEGKLGILFEEPDVNYIKPQLELLNRTWFNLYSDAFLNDFLPVKILLSAQAKECFFDFSSWPPKINAKDVAAYFNFDNMTVSYAKAAVETITPEEEIAFAKGINRVFVDCMDGQSKLIPTDAFAQSVNYSNVSSSSSSDNTVIWGMGALQPYYEASSKNDWTQFVTMMILYSEEYLNRDVDSFSEWDWEETSWEGIFSPQKDLNGILKQRYDMVRQYYIDNYSIDLQSVGNTIDI